MWFKQLQIFQLTEAFRLSSSDLTEKLAEFTFQSCLPSLPYGAGWISPVEDEEAADSPLVQSLNGHMMFCLQTEEKILPAVVVRQELEKKIKEIEGSENRKVGHKEKLALQDEIRTTLLIRAFSKLTKIYAYIDTKNQWLVLGTANTKKTEQFLSVFKKTFGDNINPLQIKKPSMVMTSWLKHQDYSSSFSIEKSCVLQDVSYQRRVIRCKEQDLFANNIQSFIHDGCEIKQLAMKWEDRVDFVLLDDLSLQGIRFNDELTEEVNAMEAETKQQQFHANFLIMTETLSGLLSGLLDCFKDNTP